MHHGKVAAAAGMLCPASWKGPAGRQGDVREENTMTQLQKNILAAVKRRPHTLRELQNNLQVDNSRLRRLAF